MTGLPWMEDTISLVEGMFFQTVNDPGVKLPSTPASVAFKSAGMLSGTG